MCVKCFKGQCNRKPTLIFMWSSSIYTLFDGSCSNIPSKFLQTPVSRRSACVGTKSPQHLDFTIFPMFAQIFARFPGMYFRSNLHGELPKQSPSFNVIMPPNRAAGS